MHALIVEIEPRNAVIRKVGDDVVSNFFCSRKKLGVAGSGRRLAEPIERPCCAARPSGAGSESLMRMGKKQVPRSAVVEQVEIAVACAPAAQFQVLTPVAG